MLHGLVMFTKNEAEHEALPGKVALTEFCNSEPPKWCLSDDGALIAGSRGNRNRRTRQEETKWLGLVLGLSANFIEVKILMTDKQKSQREIIFFRGSTGQVLNKRYPTSRTLCKYIIRHGGGGKTLNLPKHRCSKEQWKENLKLFNAMECLLNPFDLPD